MVNIDQTIKVKNEPDDNFCENVGNNIPGCIASCDQFSNSNSQIACLDLCKSVVCSDVAAIAEIDRVKNTGIMLCNIKLANSATTNLGSTQVSTANTDSRMISEITNQFDSEIEKTINQTNTDLNFGQSNSSIDKTSISQNIKNTIKNAIESNAENTSSQLSNTKQEIDFINRGYIRSVKQIGSDPDDPIKKCGELDVQCLSDLPGSSGTCDFSNDAFSDLDRKSVV